MAKSKTKTQPDTKWCLLVYFNFVTTSLYVNTKYRTCKNCSKPSLITRLSVRDWRKTNVRNMELRLKWSFPSYWVKVDTFPRRSKWLNRLQMHISLMDWIFVSTSKISIRNKNGRLARERIISIWQSRKINITLPKNK